MGRYEDKTKVFVDFIEGTRALSQRLKVKRSQLAEKCQGDPFSFTPKLRSQFSYLAGNPVTPLDLRSQWPRREPSPLPPSPNPRSYISVATPGPPNLGRDPSPHPSPPPYQISDLGISISYLAVTPRPHPSQSTKNF